ncbi:kelch-like 1, partial [Paramuricea clavata]
TMKGELLQMQHQVKEMFNTQKEMLEAIRNLTTAYEMSTAKGKAASSHDTKGNIVVLGGQNGVFVSSSWLNSVEVYSLANRTWSKLAPMQERRAAATAHFHNDQVMVTGGSYGVRSATWSVEYIQIPGKDLSFKGLLDAFLIGKLPFECCGHKTTILNDYLWLVGGSDFRNQQPCSSAIYMKSLQRHSTGIFQIKCRMPEPLSYHALEVVDNEILIIGGSTNGGADGIVKTVLSYNTATNALREVHPLPFPMADMATVKHGDDVIIIGGVNKDREYLNTVFK